MTTTSPPDTSMQPSAVHLAWVRLVAATAEREKARRRLDKLVSQGLVRVLNAGDRTTNQATRWGAL